MFPKLTSHFLCFIALLLLGGAVGVHASFGDSSHNIGIENITRTIVRSFDAGVGGEHSLWDFSDFKQQTLIPKTAGNELPVLQPRPPWQCPGGA